MGPGGLLLAAALQGAGGSLRGGGGSSSSRAEETGGFSGPGRRSRRGQAGGAAGPRLACRRLEWAAPPPGFSLLRRAAARLLLLLPRTRTENSAMWGREAGGAAAGTPGRRRAAEQEEAEAAAAAVLAAPAAIELPAEEEEGRPEPQWDESDWPAECRVSNGSQRLRNITSSVANQLLLVSLLEHLCHVYAQDPTRARRLFELLGKTFTRMRLLSPFAFRDEFSSLRLQHNRAITELMKAANQQIRSGELGNGDSYANRENQVLFEAQTSRYINEFDEVSQLGKGGYGTVFKVRNKLDGQFYAIKKILIRKATKRDCMKVLREVKVLAGLQHPNIVGYHTAWMEHVQPACPKGETVLQLPSLKMSSLQESTEDQSSDQDMEDSSSIIFADLAPEGSMDQDGEGNDMDACELPDEFHQSSGTDGNASGHTGNPPSVVQCGSQGRPRLNTSSAYSEEECSQKGICLQTPCEMEYRLMLHIQMQLCEISLWDWIAERNERLRTEKNPSPYHHVDITGTLKIFQELLEGVYYIHSMGVMHRDIKPRNIFLQGSGHHVRIGDFGLACRDIITEATSQLRSTKKRNELIHTSGVGTCLYASPEQLQGSQYDFKSDMYSLGVVLLELFQPFGTEMERTDVLMGLRNGHIPLSFSRKWPKQTKYVKLLTSKVSSYRPTASQLLESELFHNTANVICHLQQKVMQQEEEIKSLRERVNLLLQEKVERERIKQLGSPV
ncbi:eukaryotic translation initiation factor 2-alpha kinase 1 isoform X2 [Hemicordylus capensis]|uniref:eukaryotic translation initiation factor 2-alpha kinase 1 isoform X2 n=1 Tax=Hemicordylus capensis TaxID=884348 RepID=UPI002302D309|nr:eukaryotic translation initiation factor 2-alpha kinase 1 isoform X2 [Hemicordylus capensis]